MEAPTLETRLAVIQNTSPLLRSTPNGFKIILPENSYIEAATEEDDSLCVNVEDLYVANQSLRNHGIGSRLVRVLTSYCSAIGVDHIDSHITNPVAMRNRGRIFGESTLHFIEVIGNEEIELPLSIDQATASLERASAIWESATYEERDSFDPAIMTRVYLRDVDTTTWEMPEVPRGAQAIVPSS